MLFFIFQEEIDEKDLIYIENISNIKFDNYANLSFNFSPNNENSQVNNINSNIQRKRLKPAEALTKSPLIKWNEPIEDWRALVTEDIFDHHLINNNNDDYHTPPARRYTLNVFEAKNKFSFSNSEKAINRNSRHAMNVNNNYKRNTSKVSNNWILAKNKIIETAYMKSGPGYHDFGFVSIQELVKVRKIERPHFFYCCIFIHMMRIHVFCKL